MTTTATKVIEIPEIDHREAMALAEREVGHLLDVVGQLNQTDWSRPTDCEGWDVKALLSHVLGAMEASARPLEFVRQYRAATKAAKRSDRSMIDEMTALQVRDHASLSPAEIAGGMQRIAPKAVRGRRRIPAVMRAVPFTPGPPIEGRCNIGYLIATIMNRDAWMHRVDLTRATDTELVLTADHDARVVADVVADWARTHRQPFTLTLDGPAGGTFAQGERGEDLHLDAVEFCRILSGRGHSAGLLNHQVAF